MHKTVYIVGRNSLSRTGLRTLLETCEFKVVGECPWVQDGATVMVDGAMPQLVVLDAGLDAKEAVQQIRLIRAMVPDVPIVTLADGFTPQALAEAFSAGVDGYLVKDILPDALLQSLHLVMLGEKVLPTHLAALLVHEGAKGWSTETPNVAGHSLSGREVQILQCLVQGYSNKMIANWLYITEATVKVHMKSLLRKINASNRTQAAIWAVNNGLVQEDQVKEAS